MPIDVVHGAVSNNIQAGQLAEVVSLTGISGTLYLGYPVLVNADDRQAIDALFLCSKGPVVFLFANAGADRETEAVRQDAVYFALETYLRRTDGLRRGRELMTKPSIVTIGNAALASQPGDGLICTFDTVSETLAAFEEIDPIYFRALQAALQRVTTIRPAKKRSLVNRGDSRGGKLKKIEKEIANLDQWQQRAAIECADGPQRIRGLAGSGKTVVLALKAAYLHTSNPDWTILVTFYTRSLYQQFRDLIRRFCFEHVGDEPDWSKIKVMHAWGTRELPGVYRELCGEMGLVSRDFAYAKSQYGMSGSFQGIVRELLSVASSSERPPLYDAVLIDEGQDLPPEFFQLVYAFTKPPKRITWAYDELQTLTENMMPDVAELFGRDSAGLPRVSLNVGDGEPERDTILPVCYRNTPWALTIAHALGLGIYRRKNLVQHFDDPRLWTEIGYRITDGLLEKGQRVELERDRAKTPKFFYDLIAPDDAVVVKVFDDFSDELDWVADEIRVNIERDELEADDIVVVVPDTVRAPKIAQRLVSRLSQRGIASHIVGVTTGSEEFFSQDSVAIANIFRSKGNEAAMVYVVGAEHCFDGHELIQLRNALFTAITRSKAWVRISGGGDAMTGLVAEIESVISKNYRLSFRIPTNEELARMRTIHRDRTQAEKRRIRDAEKGLEKYLEAVGEGETDIEKLPPGLRKRLLELLAPNDDA